MVWKFFKNSPNLKNYKMDYSKIDKIKDKNIDVNSFASIANDPMAEIDKNLSWETSALNTFKLMELIKKNKIRKYIMLHQVLFMELKKIKELQSKNLLEWYLFIIKLK